MDNSGTKEEATAREPLDTREHRERESAASHHALDTAACPNALLAQFCDISHICRRQRAHDYIDFRKRVEHIYPYDLAKPSFHAIAIHR